MGIDAEVFVRTKKPLSPERVRELSWMLGCTVGAKKFFIHPEDDRHCLTIIEPCDDPDEPEEMRGKVFKTQDGPTIVAEPGEQFIEAHLWSRYYGPRYERGDWPTIKAVIEFLRRHVPDGAVWYGGDSSGVLAEEMTDERIAQIHGHYLDHGHQPYQSFFGRGEQVHTCDFCKQPAANHGGGGDVDFFLCHGCGQKWRVSPTRTMKLGPSEDFHDAHQRMRQQPTEPIRG